MPAEVQTKLLRVLEDNVVVPVGASKGKNIDVKVVAATNAELEDKLETKEFRSDLYYRLAGFAISIPPLRERSSDIPLLTDHFVELLSDEMGFMAPAISKEALEVLEEHDYPGNVRELRNLIERALLESNGAEIQPEHLRFVRISKSTQSDDVSEAVIDLPDKLSDAEQVCIKRVLAKTNGNLTAAAKLLGISRAKLYRRLNEMGIDHSK